MTKKKSDMTSIKTVKKINPFSTIKVDPERFHLKELYDRGPQFAVVMGLALRRFDYK